MHNFFFLNLLIVVFWACLGLTAYAYAGYAMAIGVLSRLFGSRPTPPPIPAVGLPSATLLIAAHNEATVIGARVDNALGLDYPGGRLAVVIASDGSTDGTAEIARSRPGVLVLDHAERRGKSAVLNRAIADLSTDLVLLSDANTFNDPDAARNLARWFADPSVISVVGKLILNDPVTGANADSLYWKYETFLKTCEARLGGLLGANGAIYAIRRDRYVPIPDNTIVDDFVIPLLAKQAHGGRIVYDTTAIAREETPASLGSEFGRRARIGAGGFQAIGLLWRLLDPRRGWIAFTFASHKVLRWTCPAFLIGCLASNLAIVALGGPTLYSWLLAGQGAFYLTAALVSFLPPGIKILKPLRLTSMFTGMNLALLVGFFRWLRGTQGRGLAANGSMNLFILISVGVVGVAAIALGWRRVRACRGLDRWLPGYLLTVGRRRRPDPVSEVHLLLCICDHFEPMHHAPSVDAGRARVARWVEDYPQLFSRFRDEDGRPPRHTFFYPMEQYDPDHIDALAALCRLGFGEVEIHLHHDHETSEGVRSRLSEYRQILADRHGLLARRSDGSILYGFIHGNWCLDNSRPDGRDCGVNDEINALIETGCYADFTMPSAPDPTQTSTINSLYYATDDPDRPKSHDRGTPVGLGPAPKNALMMIQGPTVLSWRRPKWGVLPRIENACIQANQPATIDRLDDWLRAGVRVPSRPDWYFVKLHTHGGPESNQTVLLDAPMVRLHEGLSQRARDDPRFHVHYVTARELYNLARAAEAGWSGSVAGALDYELRWNGAIAAPTGKARTSEVR